MSVVLPFFLSSLLAYHLVVWLFLALLIPSHMALTQGFLSYIFCLKSTWGSRSHTNLHHSPASTFLNENQETLAVIGHQVFNT